MTTPTQPTPATLTRPTPCIACAYDLMGLSPHARCPECATPIATTLAQIPLAHAADPAFLRRLATAAYALASAILALVIAVSLILYINDHLPRFITAPSILIWGATLLAVFIAAAFFTTPHADVYQRLRNPRSRPLVRIAAITASTTLLVHVAALLTVPALRVELLVVATILATLTAFTALALYARIIARALNADQIARTFTPLAWVAPFAPCTAALNLLFFVPALIWLARRLSKTARLLTTPTAIPTSPD